MTSQERLTALVEGKKTDRIPVFASVDSYAAMLYGMELKDYYTNVEKCVKAQLLAKELHGYDDSPTFGWADWGGWEFGGAIRFPESYIESAPTVIRRPIGKPGDVDKLMPPPADVGMVSLLLEFNRIVRSYGFHAIIRAGSVSSVAASIVGRETLLRWYLKEPEAALVVYLKAEEFILKAAEAIIHEFGAPNCVALISAPLDSNDLISPGVFQRFAAPSIEKINKRLMEWGVRRFSLHLCGDHTKNLTIWSGLSWPERMIVSIGGMDLAQTADAFGGGHILAGNLSTTLLALGSFEDVYEACRRIIEQGKRLPGGFILASACSAPTLTPPLNIHAMVRAVSDFGACH